MESICLHLNYHLNNKIFDIDDPVSNRDGCNYWVYLLQAALRERGFNLETYDRITSACRVNLYFDMPRSTVQSGVNILFLLEPPSIRPDNFILARHDEFDFIFTWSQELLKLSNKYKEIFYYQDFSRATFLGAKKRFFTALICGNKFSYHKDELYSFRRSVISEFEDLHLYGFGWESRCFRSSIMRKIARLVPWVSNIFYKPPKNYKGLATDKISVLSNYKFAFAIENQCGMEGYITEKIFDVFFSGSVPLYLGSNIPNDIIPQDCYIDISYFSDLKSLEQYLKEMPEDVYDGYLERIRYNFASGRFDAFNANLGVPRLTKDLLEVANDLS